MTDRIAGRIHEASLDLLEDPGIKIEHDEIYHLMISAGSVPGHDAQVVRIPPKMIEEHLKLCPSQVVLANRKGAPIVQSCKSPPIFWSCPGMAIWRRGEHRPFTSSDMGETARLLEGLDNVDVVFGLSMDDVPPPVRDVVGLKIIAANCSKHVRVLCFSPGGARLLAEMKPVVSDEAWVSVGFTAHGPLRWTNLALSIFQGTAGAGIPATVNGEPMAGVSGPVTLAGSAAVGNAEILAGIVINQLLEPHRSIIYNLGLAHVFDMKTAIAVTGGPENALFADLSAVMGRFYNIPSCSWVSTESMCPDEQAGLEKMFGFQAHWDSRVTNIWGVGQLESEITFSPAQAVIDNEMIDYIRRFRRGVEVRDDTLAVGLTRSLGPAASFLEQDHTLERFRDEFFDPKVLFRRRRDDWNKSGKPTLADRAERIANELIARPVRDALDENQINALEQLANRALSEL